MSEKSGVGSSAAVLSAPADFALWENADDGDDGDDGGGVAADANANMAWNTLAASKKEVRAIRFTGKSSVNPISTPGVGLHDIALDCIAKHGHAMQIVLVSFMCY